MLSNAAGLPPLGSGSLTETSALPRPPERGGCLEYSKGAQGEAQTCSAIGLGASDGLRLVVAGSLSEPRPTGTGTSLLIF